MAWALGLTSVQQCSIRPMGLQLCAQAIRAGRGHVPAMASQRPSAGSIHRFLRTPPPKSRRVGDTPPQYIPSPSPLPPQQGQRLGRIQLAKQVPTDHPPTDPSLIPHTSSPKRTILRPILFSLAVVGLSFGVASYERARGRWAAEDKTKLGALFNLDTFFGTDSRSSTPATKPKPGSWETYLPEPLFRIKSMLTHSWDTAKPSLKLVYSIIGLNTTIFLLWRIPSLQPFMLRHFTHHPLSGRSYTLLTSAFSHEGLLHLTFNMYALYGFGTLLQDRVLGSTEQMGAFYVSAAVLASLGSHLFTTLWLGKYRAVKGSLGASGAIWATLTGCAAMYPHLPVGIIFLPGLHFTMGDLLPLMVGLDVVGLVRGWAMFDHAAHLTGAVVGWLYVMYGRRWWVEGQGWWDRWRREGGWR